MNLFTHPEGAELDAFLAPYTGLKLDDGQQTVIYPASCPNATFKSALVAWRSVVESARPLRHRRVLQQPVAATT